MRRVIETLGGLWELLRLAMAARFRISEGYLHWRRETAFGSQPARRLTRAERLRAMLEYGRWVWRMKHR